MSSPKPIMRAQDITKAYGGTHALRGVDFEIYPGEVTVLLGENGAGKSTLMKILAGVEQPSSGTIYLRGEPVTFASPPQAVAQGVAIIHQELNLCPNLSVSDNMFLGREIVERGGVDFAAQNREARQYLEELQEPINPKTLAGNLRLGQQQVVEIARALSEQAQVLIMDEPTSALSNAEVQVLFQVINDLKAKGVAIVYISHHLEECLEIGDRAVVLRDGRVVAHAPMTEVDIAWMVSQMVGREESNLYADMTYTHGPSLLEVRGAVVADDEAPGRLSVRGVDLDVRQGEVVGIFGLMGAGRTELLEAIAGRNRFLAGSLTLDGEDLTGGDIARRISKGIMLVPEDRQKDGLVQSLSVGGNIALAAILKFVRGMLISRPAEKKGVEQVAAEVRVKAASMAAPIGSLSGGNQQKVVVGKALLTSPSVMVLDEPTRGIDVGAKADIFALMANLSKEGKGVLFATSEVGEVLHACDRILVMARGKFVAELDPRETNREQLMALADDASADTEEKE